MHIKAPAPIVLHGSLHTGGIVVKHVLTSRPDKQCEETNFHHNPIQNSGISSVTLRVYIRSSCSVSVSFNGYLFLCVSTVKNWQPIKGVPH